MVIEEHIYPDCALDFSYLDEHIPVLVPARLPYRVQDALRNDKQSIYRIRCADPQEEFVYALRPERAILWTYPRNIITEPEFI